MNQRRGIASNAAFTLVFQLVSAFATIVTGIVIARALGPIGRGYFSYAIASLGILTTYSDAASNAVMAQYKVDELPSAVVYRAMLRVLPWVSLVLGGATFFISRLVPGQSSLLAVACALPFALYIGTATTFLVADGRVQQANAVNAITVVGIMLVVVPLLLFAHVAINAVLVVWVLCYAIAAALTAVWTRAYGAGEFDPGAVVPTAKNQFLFSLKSVGVYLTAYLNLRIGLFIVAGLSGPVALGLYSLGVGTGELLWKWSQALNWAASGRVAGGSLEQTARLTAKLTRVIFLLQGLCALVLIAVAPWLITTIYGVRFEPSVAVLRVLLPGIVAYSLELALGYFVMVKLKRPMLTLTIQGVSAVSCGLLTLVLLPRYGLVGAAFATSLTYTAVTITAAVIFLRATGTRPLDLVIPRWSDFQGPVTGLHRVLTRLTQRALRRTQT